MELMYAMEENVNVIVDFSGSMTELGKSAILKSMVMRIRTIVRQYGAKASFSLWQDEMIPFKGKWDINPTGKSNPTALNDFIAAKPGGEKYLLLSDGIGTADAAATISRALTDAHAVLVAVAVGRDADFWSLAHIGVARRVWNASDIVSAVDFLCVGTSGEKES